MGWVPGGVNAATSPGGNPGIGVTQPRDGSAVADDGQCRLARRADHRDLAAHRACVTQVDRHEQLAGAGQPVTLIHDQAVQRPAQGRSAYHGVLARCRWRPGRRLGIVRATAWLAACERGGGPACLLGRPRPPAGAVGRYGDGELGVGTSELGNAGDVAGGGELRTGDLGGVDGDRDVGAVMDGEAVGERLVGVGEQGNAQDGGGSGGRRARR